MNTSTSRKVDVLSSIGLALGAVFGMTGTLVTEARLRNILWAIDSTGLVLAGALLTIKFIKEGEDFVAAGFLIFAIGEAVILSGTAGSLEGSVPAFAAGTALWALALLLISIPRAFALWTRLIGIAACCLFALTSAQIFWGRQLLPTSSPLPFFAYPFLVATFAGWIWKLLGVKNKAAKEPQRGTAAHT